VTRVEGPNRYPAPPTEGAYPGRWRVILTFAPSETTETLTVEVKGDSMKEADETFYLELFGLSTNALFAKNRGLGTILNDD
jgi:hypothetical protein